MPKPLITDKPWEKHLVVWRNVKVSTDSSKLALTLRNQRK